MWCYHWCSVCVCVLMHSAHHCNLGPPHPRPSLVCCCQTKKTWKHWKQAHVIAFDPGKRLLLSSHDRYVSEDSVRRYRTHCAFGCDRAPMSSRPGGGGGVEGWCIPRGWHRVRPGSSMHGTGCVCMVGGSCDSTGHPWPCTPCRRTTARFGRDCTAGRPQTVWCRPKQPCRGIHGGSLASLGSRTT